MITAQVYDVITNSDVVQIATAVGIPCSVHQGKSKEFVILSIAGRDTFCSVSGDGRLLTLVDVCLNAEATSQMANQFNRDSGSWAGVFIDDDGDAVLSMAILALGATRDHIALLISVWRNYVKDFERSFA